MAKDEIVKGEMTKDPTPAVQSSDLVLPEQVLPGHLFVLPVPGPVIFPTLVAPILISIPKHIATVEEVLSRGRILGLVLPRAGSEISETLPIDSACSVGVAVKILKRLKLPDGGISILVHSIRRFRVRQTLSDHPHWVVDAEYLEDHVEKDMELDALTRSVVSSVKKLSETNPFFTEEMRLAMINAPGPGAVADLVGFALSLSLEDSQLFLETLDVKKRFEFLLQHLRREQEVSDLQRKISDDVNTKVQSLQREFFLKEQLRVIKKELGMEEDSKEKTARGFRERIDAAQMPAEIRESALQELAKFESIPETSPEHNLTRSYLETLVSLPWAKETEDRLHLQSAREILDAQHFGLTKVKERILETLAVRKLKKDTKGSILCLVGPPGVGKTSIGKSIAETMGRQFQRVSLGGMRDEAEIKGHRRTYVGAMPGKLIQSLKRAGSKNAVIMLDEIDKLGSSFQGDPASALLEVLDPEQNGAFLDHYLDVPFDLSRVLFITTANTVATIPAPLLDRMEVIELPGYTLEEKAEIAQRYTLPRALAEAGIQPKQLRLEKSALAEIIRSYAREPGMRVLTQMLNRLARKVAAQIVEAQENAGGDGQRAIALRAQSNGAVVIRTEDLGEWLGPARFFNEVAERANAPGVVTGLAWTAMGGAILFVEANQLQQGSGQFKMTGQMGEVMLESASIAWTVTKKKWLQNPQGADTDFKTRDIHLHLPAGAVPKDGPSAGITMATAFWSMLSGKPVRGRMAMTGELSLVGKVLPVGGIKEKLLAAHRAGVTTVIIPSLNAKDLPEVPEEVRKALTIHCVQTLDEVFAHAFGPDTQNTRVIKKRVGRISSLRKSLPAREKAQKRPAKRVTRF